MSVLEKLKVSSDIKNLTIKELELLAKELREKIIDTAKSNGGHLSSNLGIVETTIALYYVFDFPVDKLVFDVGHQCYAHKILSGRKDEFSTIRTDGGLSGFPDIDESEYDAFTAGHAGTSIAAGLGLCTAREKLNKDYTVIDVVGDGSIINGLNLEAMTASTIKPKNFIVILNDNGMSISLNKNGFYEFISKRTMGKNYVRSKKAVKKVFGNSFITRFFRKIKNFIKSILNRNNYFENFGFKYVGVVDGNNLKSLIKIFEKVRNSSKNKAVFLHLKTQKGSGYDKAEESPETYHGVSKNFESALKGFSSCLGEKLSKVIALDKKVVAITAGMKYGTGLAEIEKKYPNNFIDVGIAEEYAVTLSAGMAKGGIKPIFCVYSTFLQRAYDQILHDVCLQNLPVIFCVDRAGLVGADGKTHQGVFDLSFLSHLPNLSILAPTCADDLDKCIDYALALNRPVVIRYPNGVVDFERKTQDFSVSLFEELEKGKGDTVILAVGPRMVDISLKANEKLNKICSVYSARSIKPLDEKVLSAIKKGKVITLEENVLTGGFGWSVRDYFKENKKVSVITLGIKDEFIKHGSILSQLEYNGLTEENLIKIIQE